MKKLSKQAKEEIISWLDNIKVGDRIVFNKNRIVAYDNATCELASIDW